MTKTQVLQKAIAIAVERGWRPLPRSLPTRIESWQGDHMVVVGVVGNRDGEDYESQWVRELEGIIFSHDFARALWGNDIPKKDFKPTYKWNERLGRYNSWSELQEIETRPAWVYHLQEMVISDDPIKYLEDNMPESK